jgi:hypothetical protein
MNILLTAKFGDFTVFLCNDYKKQLPEMFHRQLSLENYIFDVKNVTKYAKNHND